VCGGFSGSLLLAKAKAEAEAEAEAEEIRLFVGASLLANLASQRNVFASKN